MKNYIEIIKKSPLFFNIEEDEIIRILYDFKAEIKYFDKRNIIIYTGDTADSIYFILNGNIEISKEYDDARKNIVNILTNGDIFAESLALSSNKISPIQAVSLHKSELLKIEVNNIFKNNNDKINNNTRVIFIQNLMRIISDKNKFLSFKNDILSQKSLRSKIIMYLKYMYNIQKSKTITVPYNRDKLSEFISSDRSALSRELNRLSNENIIKLEKNKIVIINLSL